MQTFSVFHADWGLLVVHDTGHEIIWAKPAMGGYRTFICSKTLAPCVLYDMTLMDQLNEPLDIKGFARYGDTVASWINAEISRIRVKSLQSLIV
jgi:hypothetical protein